jgi:hypothetical protein
MSEKIQNNQTNRSPPFGIVAVIFVLLFVASIATAMIMTNGAPYPNPYKPVDRVASGLAADFTILSSRQ